MIFQITTQLPIFIRLLPAGSLGGFSVLLCCLSSILSVILKKCTKLYSYRRQTVREPALFPALSKNHTEQRVNRYLCAISKNLILDW